MLGANEVRVAILCYLARHPNSTVTDLARELEVSRSHVYGQVQVLIETGAVTSDPPSPAQGQRTRLTVNAAVVKEEMNTLLRQITPSRRGRPPEATNENTGSAGK